MQSEENRSSMNMEIDESGENSSQLSLEKGEGSKVVFSRESTIVSSSAELIEESSCSSQDRDSKRIHRQSRVQLGRTFQLAVISHNWELAQSVISIADSTALNDMLCMSLDFVWFLTNHEDQCGVTSLIKEIVKRGASDFTRAMLRTSFLASCVSACQSNMMSSGDDGTVLSKRLRERLHEYHKDEVLKHEASLKVQRFMEWALRCIGFHSCRRADRSHGPRYHVGLAASEVQLRLTAFKFFLNLAGDSLAGKDFTEAFDAACFPLTLFSSLFDPGWSEGPSAALVEGLLGLLVEWGVDNLNQCFLEASRFGSTELVRILLQIARRNGLEVDVDLALGFASHYNNTQTMACLVEEGHASSFLGPLMRAAERGSHSVVQWFVSRGCRPMELCLALTAAASSSHLPILSLLLPLIPRSILHSLSSEILRSAAAGPAERSAASLTGVEFLLQSDFLNDPATTYAAAEAVVGSAPPGLREFLRESWSEEAFVEGVRRGEEEFVNLVRVLERGGMEIRLRELPRELVVAVGWLGLYKECVGSEGRLLNQRLRGRLVAAVRRLTGEGSGVEGWGKEELLAVLEWNLPRFLIQM